MKKSVKHTGGEAFDPREHNVYFLASNMERMLHGATHYTHLLMAINEIKGQGDLDQIKAWEHDNKRVFIDSGVFDFAMQYARKHNVPMDVALSQNPQDAEGFEDLFDRYVDTIRCIGQQSWGYVEIDLGGRENKIKTRSRLERLGLAPIPVYHPLNDGWDYFDYLAQRYDRICFGNVVQAEGFVRKRLIATAWERHCKYPDLWIHLLGYTPNQALNAYPINSCDSSSWLAPVRFGAFPERTALQPFSTMGDDFIYATGDTEQARFATKVSAYSSTMNLMNWRNHINYLNELGFKNYD